MVYPTVTHVGQFASTACLFVPRTEAAGELSDDHQPLSKYKRIIFELHL